MGLQDPDRQYRRLARDGRIMVAVLAFVFASSISVTLIAPWRQENMRAMELVPAVLATLSAAFLSPLLWSRLVLDATRFRVVGGALSGFVTVGLVHFVTVDLSFAALATGSWIDDAQDLRWADWPLILTVPLRTIAVLGWLTLPLGAFAGYAVALLCQYRLRKMAGAPCA